jgi:SAM-dependent methyltransferase
MSELRQAAHLCPYTRRGYEKPRGYPGDAVLLDYIYGTAPAPDDTTSRGMDILGWMRRYSPAFASVRWRRDYFASRIDELAANRRRPRIASVACGHLREGHRSVATVSGHCELIAIDQDERSLDLVTHSHPTVTPLRGSVRDILTRRLDLEGCDLIYAAGLYDYLEDRLAKRLTLRLFDALVPGGTLVVANFIGIWEAGWMEALMEWHLLYRAQEELLRLAEEIPPALAEVRVDAGPSGNVAYLEVTRV